VVSGGGETCRGRICAAVKQLRWRNFYAFIKGKPRDVLSDQAFYRRLTSNYQSQFIKRSRVVGWEEFKQACGAWALAVSVLQGADNVDVKVLGIVCAPLR
jgi:hypothetical protein